MINILKIITLIKEINYKKEYGKEMRSRTSSSNKSL